MIILKRNERLVYGGIATLRAPNGEPLPSVKQYMIVPADEADPTAVVELQKNERLVYGGRAFKDRKRAEERFAALKAGREPPPREVGTPLYFIEDAANINKKTGRTVEGDEIINALSRDFAEILAMQKRKEKELKQQKREN